MLDTKKAELRENLIAQSKRENFRAMAAVKPLNNSGIFSSNDEEINIFNIPVRSLNLQNSTSEKAASPVFELKEMPAPVDEFITLSEETDLKNIPVKRLRITTTAAPVYFDNFGGGNAIDARFADNESGGEISMAYGVNFAYQLSNRLKIRSGINKV
ncbi:MAG TPA: hypothetical protein VLN46_03020, partial [Gillisia sp.]|nr:hypothetical protein [Gillisia sp.]